MTIVFFCFRLESSHYGTVETVGAKGLENLVLWNNIV